METTVEKKKIGNPNFGAKKKEPVLDTRKRYVFVLTETHESAKGRDKDTNELSHNPYPPIYIVPNSGVAFDPETKQPRRWRYLHNYNSIWVDEQLTPEPSKQDLESDRNSLIFRNGHLGVMGHEVAKMKALMVQDAYEGNENPLEHKPKIFRLINEDLELEKVESGIDAEYEALKIANEYKIEDLLPAAMVLGINVDNYEENQAKIRAQFKIKAKQMPRAILQNIANPKNEIKYIFTLALQKDIVSSSKVDGKLVMVETNNPLLEINSNGDVADQLATMVMSRDERATKVYESLKRLV